MVLGDGVVVGWLGHPSYRLPDGSYLYPRRMPSFFETFPTLFVDREGVVKADQPLRWAEAKYALEGIHLSVVISGGALDGTKLEALDTLNTLARTSQFGELLEFDRESVTADGTLRWSFAHLCCCSSLATGGTLHVPSIEICYPGWKRMPAHL